MVLCSTLETMFAIGINRLEWQYSLSVLKVVPRDSFMSRARGGASQGTFDVGPVYILHSMNEGGYCVLFSQTHSPTKLLLVYNYKNTTFEGAIFPVFDNEMGMIITLRWNELVKQWTYTIYNDVMYNHDQ